VQVLVVCEINVARSPLFAAILASRLASHDVAVASAGIRARHGDRPADGSVRLASERGLDISGHRSRPLTAELVEAADLVLTMSERQRVWARRLVAEEHQAIFALRRFAMLVDPRDESVLLGQRSTTMNRLRALTSVDRPRARRDDQRFDVPDPINVDWPTWVELGESFDDLAGRIAAPILRWRRGGSAPVAEAS
jgi:protein-tyrosine phosphatase